MTLHGEGADLDQLTPLFYELGEQYKGLFVEGPLVLTPYTIGDYGRSDGYGWYIGEGNAIGELVRFGYALCALEELLADFRGSVPGIPLSLIGYRQGADMALTLAKIAPDLMDGVLSICGDLPTHAAWQPPLQPDLNGLPVMLVNAAGGNPAAISSASEKLAVAGAAVSEVTVPGCAADPGAAAEVARRFVNGVTFRPTTRTPAVRCAVEERR